MQKSKSKRPSRKSAANFIVRHSTLPRDHKFDYKRPEELKNYLSETYKILPRRSTGLTRQHQNDLVTQIKRARMLALLPYSDVHSIDHRY